MKCPGDSPVKTHKVRYPGAKQITMPCTANTAIQGTALLEKEKKVVFGFMGNNLFFTGPLFH